MAIPKGLLQVAMQSTRVLKSDETVSFANIGSELVNETNNSKLTFRRDSKPPVEKLNNEQSTKISSINYPDIVMLTGSEKKIIIQLCEKKEKHDNGKLITKTIHLSILSQDTGIPITTIKKSIQRLEKKGFLKRVVFKAGREGWTIYSIPSSIFKGLL